MQQARSLDSVDARAALAQLCASYWPPLYAFARRGGSSADEAAELVQDFFAASEVRERVVAIGPSHAQLRPDDIEIERREAADRRFAGRAAGLAVLGFIVSSFAGGLHWDEHSFGYHRGTRFTVHVGWFVVAWWLGHCIRLMALQRACEPNSQRAHALSARLGAVFAAGLFAFALTRSGTGIYVPLAMAAWAAYSTWLAAARHRIPARIVLGPLWWMHRWNAGLEPET